MTYEGWKALTGAFDLFDIVARKPASFAIKRPLPPAAVLLPYHLDDVALTEGQLILIGRLEVEPSFYEHLRAAVVRHVLERERVRENLYYKKHLPYTIQPYIYIYKYIYREFHITTILKFRSHDLNLYTLIN